MIFFFCCKRNQQSNTEISLTVPNVPFQDIPTLVNDNVTNTLDRHIENMPGTSPFTEARNYREYDTTILSQTYLAEANSAKSKLKENNLKIHNI